MKNIAFISLIAITLVFTSCKKDRFDDTIQKPENMEELTVPSNFDWKTTKDIQLTLSAPSNGIVEVTNSQNVVYQKAFLATGQSYTMKLSLPTYEKTIKIRFMGQEVNIELSGSVYSHSF
jgi:hypothetical protein